MNEKAKQYVGKEKYTYEDLREIVKILRGKDGCPWDMEQTHKSIRRDLIEECYEVVEAIDNDDPVLMCEELGDLLLQVVFHADICREVNGFGMDEVADGICRKLVTRHPHVFGDVTAETSEKVLENWDKIKKTEKQRNTLSAEMYAVPPALPALMRANKVGKKSGKANFDFPTDEEAFAKVTEELNELYEVRNSGDKERIADEMGDLLFSVVNVSRKVGVEPEEALTRATEKFMRRFKKLEQAADEKGVSLADMSPEEADILWEQIKNRD